MASSGVELSLKAIPALWSPDSDFFLYAKRGSLYYFSVSQLREKRVLAESYRLVGKGTVRNVRWGPASSAGGSALYYVTGSLVYRLRRPGAVHPLPVRGFPAHRTPGRQAALRAGSQLRRFLGRPRRHPAAGETRAGGTCSWSPSPRRTTAARAFRCRTCTCRAQAPCAGCCGCGPGRSWSWPNPGSEGPAAPGVYLLSAADLRALPSFRRIPEEGVLDLALSRRRVQRGGHARRRA